jgi:hypothetical protein
MLLYQVSGKKGARDLIFKVKRGVIKGLKFSGSKTLPRPQDPSDKLMKDISLLPGLPWREI